MRQRTLKRVCGQTITTVIKGRDDTTAAGDEFSDDIEIGESVLLAPGEFVSWMAHATWERSTIQVTATLSLRMTDRRWVLRARALHTSDPDESFRAEDERDYNAWSAPTEVDANIAWRQLFDKLNQGPAGYATSLRCWPVNSSDPKTILRALAATGIVAIGLSEPSN